MTDKNTMPEVIYVQYNVDYPKALEASAKQFYKGDTKYISEAAHKAEVLRVLDRVMTDFCNVWLDKATYPDDAIRIVINSIKAEYEGEV